MKLAHRLLIFALGLIVLLIAGILSIVDGRLRDRIIEYRVAGLHREANLVAGHWLSGAAPRELAQTSSITLGGRVTLVDNMGDVVGDFHRGKTAPKLSKTSRFSPRIVATTRNEAGFAVLSDSVGAMPQLYVSNRNAAGITRVAVETAPLDHVFDIARSDILKAGVVAAALALLFSIGYATYVSGPVIQLRDLARALALRDYGKRPQIHAPGEVGELAESLVLLSARLESLETVRREFIANISHELCSPLTIASGFAATLVKDDPPDEIRKEFAGAILSNTLRIQRIVDDLLDLSRIESGGWTPRLELVKLGQVTDEVFDSLQSLAAIKGTRLVRDPSVADAVVRADLTAVRQIIANLMENAIRHTDGGTITVFIEVDSEAICIAVRDTGEGISPAHLPRIFERFYRVDKGRARQSGGTGLGLAIVRHMAEAHGGRVAAESTVERGTTIRTFFPVRPSRVSAWTPSRGVRIVPAAVAVAPV